MIKKIYTLLILFSTISLYGQDITLLKNFNPKAKELKHDLNSTRDSLVLESDKNIFTVEIFNEDYEKKVTVDAINAKIALNDIPVGKFVVEAKLTDKIITMDLIKYNHFNDNSNSSQTKNEVAEGLGMMLDENLNVIKSPPNSSVEFILTRGKTKKPTNKSQKFYWTVTKVNNPSGSSKTVKLVNQESVDRMISKNKQEHNSVSGKLNELTVWEVYNTSKFMESQMANPNYMYSSSSEFFNTKPFYMSSHNNLALQ